ncbi:MAG: helix-turn-helix transcriptional regulator [Chloroflexi bacterium]|nr:helix-turn-helix transcriptional regulator [Chloroflexota bacterium]
MAKIPLDPIANADQTDVCLPQPILLRLSPDSARRLAGILKAMGHPVRLQIMDILSRGGGQMCVCDLEQYFDLTQPTISHHLKVLRAEGLIDAEQKGLWIYYHVRASALKAMRALLLSFGGNEDG